MDLAVSPNGKYILACTDSNRILMLPTGKVRRLFLKKPLPRHHFIVLLWQGQVHLRVFYGATNDKWSSPRACWSRCGRCVFFSWLGVPYPHQSTCRYAYATSQDNQILAWDVTVCARLS